VSRRRNDGTGERFLYIAKNMNARKPPNDNTSQRDDASHEDSSFAPSASQLTPIQELLSFDFEETPAPAKSPPSPYVRSEVNFLRYPFFVLTTRDIHKIDRIEYEEEREDSLIYWKVSRNIDHTIPGPFDKRVYRAIEEILDKLPRPVPSLVKIGSLNQLCNVMELSRAGKDQKVAGIYKRMVKQSLKRISLTGVESENAFYDKAHRRRVPSFEGAFHLFNVFFRGQLLPDGEVADAIYLHLNPLYVASLNTFYVRPLDYGYMRSLRTPLTQRLYEVLGLRFRGLKDSRYIRYDYHQLCQILPITPQRSLKDAKKILHPHHTKLQKTGYLAKIEWQASQSKQPWEILYWPGPKAKDELKRTREFVPPSHQLPDGRSSQSNEEEARIQDLLEQIRDEIKDPRWEQSVPFYRSAIQRLGRDLVYARLSETRGASREGKIRTRKPAYFIDLLTRDLQRYADANGELL
jgi:hypothetical protein